MVKMEDAERIAVDFVKKKKNPQSVNVSSVVPSVPADHWEVKGSYPVQITHGAGSEHFTIEIDKEGNVASYKFEPGFFIAVA